MQNKFGFILVNPQLGENIGSCARAMKNFGFSKLNIVSPRDGWPNTKARMTSVGAFDIIKSAKIYENVDEAVKKFIREQALAEQFEEKEDEIIDGEVIQDDWFTSLIVDFGIYLLPIIALGGIILLSKLFVLN